jgi:hypothetical protein
MFYLWMCLCADVRKGMKFDEIQTCSIEFYLPFDCFRGGATGALAEVGVPGGV